MKKERIKIRTYIYNIEYYFVRTTKNGRKVLTGKVAKTVEKLFYKIAYARGFAIQHR